jgi:hypothetical protein
VGGMASICDLGAGAVYVGVEPVEERTGCWFIGGVADEAGGYCQGQLAYALTTVR